MTSTRATPTLRTARFTLRAIERGDAQALFPTLSDPAQCRFLMQDAFADIGQLEEWLFAPDWNGRTWIAVDETGGVAARLVAMPLAEGVAEIGYITTKDRQGQGVARECAGALVHYLFRSEDHHRLTAITDPRHLASNAVLQRLGFRREGQLRQSVKTHLGWCDETVWGLLRSDWAASVRP